MYVLHASFCVCVACFLCIQQCLGQDCKALRYSWLHVDSLNEGLATDSWIAEMGGEWKMKGRGGKWKAEREGSLKIKQRGCRIAAMLEGAAKCLRRQLAALGTAARGTAMPEVLLLAGRKGRLGRWCKALLANSGRGVVCAAALQGLCQGAGASAAVKRNACGGWASSTPSREQGKATALHRWETFRKSIGGTARYCKCFRKQIAKKIANVELEKEGFFPSVGRREKSRNARCCNGHVLSQSGRISCGLRLLFPFSKPVPHTWTSMRELTGFAIFTFPRFEPINWYVWVLRHKQELLVPEF